MRRADSRADRGSVLVTAMACWLMCATTGMAQEKPDPNAPNVDPGLITAEVKAGKNIGVGFGYLREQPNQEVTVGLIKPTGKDITSNKTDNSGSTIWQGPQDFERNELGQVIKGHLWKGFGYQPTPGEPGIANEIVNSGASVVFYGKILGGPLGGDTPHYVVSVADLDIDVDSLARHRDGENPATAHWPPSNPADADNAEEDRAEETQFGGLWLPPALISDAQFPSPSQNWSVADKPYKLMRLQLRTKWEGNPDGTSLPNQIDGEMF